MPEDKKDDDGNGAVDDKDKDQKDKVSFSDEQQARLQQIVDAAYTKAFTKAEEKWKATTDSLTTQVDELKKKTPTIEPKTTPDPKKDDVKVDDNKSPSPEYTALVARLDEVQGVANNLKAKNDEADQVIAAERKKNKEARIKEQFFRAADKIEFFERMDVFTLTEQDYDLDDAGEVVIINTKTKQPRISGVDPERNMTLDQFLGEFAKSKPNMVRAKNTDGGSGAGENRSTQTVVPEKKVDYSKMTPDEMRAFTSKVISRQYTQRSA